MRFRLPSKRFKKLFNTCQRELVLNQAYLATASQENLCLRETVTVLTETNKALTAKAGTDDLTGLLRRDRLDQKAIPLYANASREQKSVFIMMIDLDWFKDINDTHGHLFGDLVLCAISKHLPTVVRPEDLIARHGGEEFVVMGTCQAPDEARSIAKRISSKS